VFDGQSGAFLSFIATCTGIAGALLGVFLLTGAPRRVVVFSGVLLAGITLFGVYPELAEHYGWFGGAAMLGAGAGVLWAFGRYVHPVCPACSHTHDHDHCARTLHGFALPLVVAGSLHAFLDGLGISASQQERAGGVAAVVLFGVMLHKIPEGIALGVILRSALPWRASALAWCIAIESATFAGALLESAVTSRLGVVWTRYALALAGGSFLYLGFHAIHGQWRRRVAAMNRQPMPEES
jgi:hypothetical protein